MLDVLNAARLKTHEVHVGRFARKYTVARQTSAVVDEAGLRSAIGARTWNKFAPRKFQKKLLEEAVDTGTIDAELVAPFLSLKEGDPYIVYTETELEQLNG